jgi:hypothetical protein
MNKVAKKLEKENWKLCHQIIDLRDGHFCVICGATERLQLDHCITRSRKILYFETDNLNYLCDRHHTTKSFQHGSPIDKKVDTITRERMGTSKFNAMVQLGEKVCPMYSTVWWQEACNEQLKEYLEFLQAIDKTSRKEWR